jgi:hypothetical protein
MKRRIIFILLLVLGVPLALLALGGLGYYREVGYGEFIPAHLANEVRNPEISILSTRLTRVGFTEFLVFSVDGPPFELQMSGTAPDQRAGTSCQLISLVVRADGTTLLSVSKKELPLNVKVQHGQQPALQGFFFSAPSFLSGTPQRLHVQGTIAFPSSAGVTPVTFERVFELDASRRIVAGSFTWHL